MQTPYVDIVFYLEGISVLQTEMWLQHTLFHLIEF